MNWLKHKFLFSTCFTKLLESGYVEMDFFCNFFLYCLIDDDMLLDQHVKMFFLLHRGYACPICNRSMVDMSRMWRQLDQEISRTPMPADYNDFNVTVRTFVLFFSLQLFFDWNFYKFFFLLWNFQYWFTYMYYTVWKWNMQVEQYCYLTLIMIYQIPAW